MTHFSAIHLPITMDDNTTPPESALPQTPNLPSNHLLVALMETVDAYVNKLVETKFQAMVENRRALSLMDQALERMIDDKIERKIDDAITSHEGRDAHFDKDSIEQITADQARETLSEYAARQEGWVTKDQVNDLITEHVDEELDLIDWEEKVKDVLREML